MTVSLSGNNAIDSLLIDKSWTGGAGQSATVTYGFGKSTNDTSDRSLTIQNNLSAVNAGFINAVQSAMNIWSSYANVSFHQATGSDQPLLIAMTNTDLSPDAAGVTYLYDSGAQLHTVDMIVGTDYAGAELNPGNYGFFTTLHELGHTLGFKHPFEDSPQLPASQDNWDHTIMAYNNGTYATMSNLPATPMLFDIAAMQYLYGANHSTHSGNDHYMLNTGSAPSALWDGGGADTLDSSNYGGSVTIDLREGDTDITHVGSTALWVAFGANIEAAQTGNGNDAVGGNSLNNTLNAGSGNDSVSGYDGADTMQGNQGTDILNGGTGNDSILGGKDNDTVFGGQGNDDVNGNIGNDSVSGDAGDDLLHGGQDNDIINGGTGNDTLNGDIGNDTLTGGSGNDLFVFTSMQAATDVVTDFVHGEDHIQFSHLIFPTADAVLAAATFSSGTETIALLGGSVILQNLSAALVSSDIFIG